MSLSVSPPRHFRRQDPPRRHQENRRWYLRVLRIVGHRSSATHSYVFWLLLFLLLLNLDHDGRTASRRHRPRVKEPSARRKDVTSARDAPNNGADPNACEILTGYSTVNLVASVIYEIRLAAR